MTSTGGKAKTRKAGVKTLPYLQVGRFRVDVDALLRLRHHCDPALCRASGCCCRSYEVCFTRTEMERAVGLMPDCRVFAPHLAPGEELENPFEALGGHRFAVDVQDDDACAFAFRDRGGAMWCAMHAAALRLDLDPWAVKAQPCLLWPLALSEDKVPVLTVQDDALVYSCNRRRHRARSLHAGVADCVAGALGKPILEKLEQAIRLLFSA